MLNWLGTLPAENGNVIISNNCLFIVFSEIRFDVSSPDKINRELSMV